MSRQDPPSDCPLPWRRTDKNRIVDANGDPVIDTDIIRSDTLDFILNCVNDYYQRNKPPVCLECGSNSPGFDRLWPCSDCIGERVRAGTIDDSTAARMLSFGSFMRHQGE